jgi:hypothetical protein
MRCAFEAGQLDMAVYKGMVRPKWLDETGRCKLEAGPDQSLCPDHLAVEEEERKHLEEFLNEHGQDEAMPNQQ